MMETPNDRSAWTATDIAIKVAAVAWLQWVGVATATVLHHVLHALPIVVLLFLPRTTGRRATSAVAAFLWIFMLATMTDNLASSWRRIAAGDTGLLSWLAPGMAAIAAAWLARDLARLDARRGRIGPYAIASIALPPILTMLHGAIGPLLLAPVERLLAGRAGCAAVVAIEAAALVLIAGAAVVRLTACGWRPRPAAAAGWTAYWGLFAACMIGGLAV